MQHTKHIDPKFQMEIEIIRIKVIMAHGFFIFLAWLFATFVVVFSLWNHISHHLLIFWFAASNSISIVRLIIYEYIKKQLSTIDVRNIPKIKLIFIFDGLITGLCLGMGNLYFVDLTQPNTLLIMSLTSYLGAMGIMFSWFNYLPTVAAYIIPVGGLLITPLFIQESEEIESLGLIILVSIACGIVACFRIREIYSTVLHLNFENAQLHKDSEKANKAKTRFLAAASHDLRQPIHALNLFFAELSDRVRNAETSKLIIQIEDSIKAINSMLSALLDISKLDAGVVKPDFKEVDLNELFQRLESEFATIANENRNMLKIRRTKAIVRSDPIMLERIIRNLVGNALRYTKKGHVLVAVRSSGDNVQIQVFDTGPGIPEDQLDEIFVEFHQVDNPERNRRQGLGLGLAIVKRLANLLNHEIKVASRLGHGSCFSITVPRTRILQQEPATQSTNNANEFSFKGSTVFILDDDSTILEGMSGLLSYWGCKVITALRSDEIFKQMKSDQVKPDLLIIDYRLAEDVSGIEIAKKIQAKLPYPLPVILLTGDTAPERLQEAVASDFQLLHKPVQIPELRISMQNLLIQHSVKNSD